jgi:hypothetical protein
LLVWSVVAELAGGVTRFSLTIWVILNVGAALAGADTGLVVEVPALVGAKAVFSGAKVWDADFSGVVGVAYP